MGFSAHACVTLESAPPCKGGAPKQTNLLPRSMMLIEQVFYVLTFVAGAFVGSFLNVVSDRLQSGESIFFGRSHCDKCRSPLSASELIPVFSFLFQKGKCRHCGNALSFYYLLSEILTGTLFVLAAAMVGVFGSTSMLPFMQWIYFVYLATALSLYVILFLSDMKYRILPDKVVIPAIVLTFLFIVFNFSFFAYFSYQQLSADAFGKYLIQAGFWQNQVLSAAKGVLFSLISASAIALFFLSLIKITRGRGMGGGDVKLGFLIGLFNGFPVNIIAIFVGFLSGALVSMVLVLLKKRGMKDTIAFGPFLIFGSVLSLVFGQQIFDWYIGLF